MNGVEAFEKNTAVFGLECDLDWDLPDLCVSPPFQAKKHIIATSTPKDTNNVNKKSTKHPVEEKRSSLPLSVKKKISASSIDREKKGALALPDGVKKKSSLKEDGKKSSSVHITKEKVSKNSTSIQSEKDGKKKASVWSNKKDKEKKDRTPATEFCESSFSSGAEEVKKGGSLPSPCFEETSRALRDDPFGIPSCAVQPSTDIPERSCFSSCADEGLKVRSLPSPCVEETSRPDGTVGSLSRDVHSEHRPGDDITPETELPDLDVLGQQNQIHFEDEILFGYREAYINSDSEDDVELFVTSAVHPPISKSKTPASDSVEPSPEALNLDKQSDVKSVKAKRRKVFVDKNIDSKTHKYFAPSFDLKECSVVLSNIKSMCPRDLRRYGVYSLRHLLKNYERRKNEKLRANNRKKQIKSSDCHKGLNHRKSKFHHREPSVAMELESLFEGRNERESISSSSSLPHKTSSKSKISSSVFDHQKYKLNKCQIKNCQMREKCSNYHDTCDRRRDPKLYKYKPSRCKNVHFSKPSKCPKGDGCGLSHSKMEIRYHPWFYKKYPCKIFLEKRHCPKGPICEDHHKPDVETHLLIANSKGNDSLSEVSNPTSIAKGGKEKHASLSLTDFAKPPSGMLIRTQVKDCSQNIPVESLSSHQTSLHTTRMDATLNSQPDHHMASTPDLSYKSESSCDISSVDNVISAEAACLQSDFVAHENNLKNCKCNSNVMSPCNCCHIVKIVSKYTTDDFVIKCFDQLMKVKEFLIFGLGEKVACLYSKIKVRSMKCRGLQEYLATSENCMLLLNVVKHLSSYKSLQIDDKFLRIKETKRLIKILHIEVFNAFNKKRYLGLDIKSVAEHTMGEDTLHVVKYVRDVLYGMGKTEVKNSVIVNICRKVMEKQNKMIIPSFTVEKDLTEERVAEEPPSQKPTVVSKPSYSGTRNNSGTNQNVYAGNIPRGGMDKGGGMTSGAPAQMNIDERLPSKQFSGRSGLCPPGRNELQPLCGTLNPPARKELQPVCDTVYPPGRNELQPICDTIFPQGKNELQPICDTLLPQGRKEMQQVCDTLYQPGRNELQPVCDTTWNISDDGMVSERDRNVEDRGYSVSNGELSRPVLLPPPVKPVSEQTIQNRSQTNDLSGYDNNKSLQKLISLLPSLQKLNNNPSELNGKIEVPNSQEQQDSFVNRMLNAIDNSGRSHFSDKNGFSGKSTQILDNYNVNGLNISKIIEGIVPATAGLTIPKVYEFTENMFKYLGMDIEKKILNYICRKVCNIQLNRAQNEALAATDPVTNPSNTLLKEVGNSMLKESKIQTSFETHHELGVKVELDQNQGPHKANHVSPQSDFSIPLNLPLPTRQKNSVDDVGVSKKGQSLLGSQSLFRHRNDKKLMSQQQNIQSQLSGNPPSKLPLSERDILRGMDWETPEEINWKKTPDNRKVCSLICIEDSPEPVTISSPEYSPEPAVIKSSRFSPIPVVIRSPEYSPEPKRPNKSSVITSRFKETFSNLPSLKNSEMNKRKKLSSSVLIPEPKRPKKTSVIFEQCITIPSSPEDNCD